MSFYVCNTYIVCSYSFFFESFFYYLNSLFCLVMNSSIIVVITLFYPIVLNLYILIKTEYIWSIDHFGKHYFQDFLIFVYQYFPIQNITQWKTFYLQTRKLFIFRFINGTVFIPLSHVSRHSHIKPSPVSLVSLAILFF